MSKSKVSLVKRKAIKNLKALIASSSEQTQVEHPSSPTPSFSPEPVDKNPFLYENLKDNIGKKVKNYFIYMLERYVYFKCNNAEELKPSVRDKRSLFAAQKPEIGWKLHISVAPHQIADAWSVIYPILMEHEISAKILDPDILKSKSVEEISSKQFTIYHFKNKHIEPGEWHSIVQHIERELELHEIGKGIIPIANKQITNSEYFSYRNDSAPGGRYISDVAAAKYVEFYINNDPQLVPYNLTKDKDPFADIILQPIEESTQVIQGP